MAQELQNRLDHDRHPSETTPPLPAVPLPDFIPAEVAFETIGYFTPSSKVIKHVTTKETILTDTVAPDGTRLLRKICIIASGKYGLPITADLDYYRAFLKILDDVLARDGQLTEPIGVPTKTLLRYAGKPPSARVLGEVKDWIRRGHATVIEGFFYLAEHGDYLEIGTEPLFPQYYLRGQRLDTGEIADTNYVWLASWFRANYLHHYVRPIDLALHTRLRKPLSKVLLPLLEMGWYAAAGQPYSKSYHALCQAFLLTEYPYRADITRQLDPAHEELAAERVLAQWTYHRATTPRDWVITYTPGEKFLEDQQTRLARRQRAARIAQGTPAPSRSPRRPRLSPLLEEILTVCGDRQNQAAYQKMLRIYPEGLLWMALSETRHADSEGRITKTTGAYFMDTVKRLVVLRAPHATSSPAVPTPVPAPETPPPARAPSTPQTLPAEASDDDDALARARQQTQRQVDAHLQTLTPVQRRALETRVQTQGALREDALGYRTMLRLAVEALVRQEVLGFARWSALLTQVGAHQHDATSVAHVDAWQLEAIGDVEWVVSVPTPQDKILLTEHYLGLLEDVISTPTQRLQLQALVRQAPRR